MGFSAKRIFSLSWLPLTRELPSISEAEGEKETLRLPLSRLRRQLPWQGEPGARENWFSFLLPSFAKQLKDFCFLGFLFYTRVFAFSAPSDEGAAKRQRGWGREVLEHPLSFCLFLSLRQNFVLPPPSSEGGLFVFQSVTIVSINKSLLSVIIFSLIRTYSTSFGSLC